MSKRPVIPGSEKYVVFHFVHHPSDYYAQSPEEEARTQSEYNSFFTCWHPRIRQFVGAHAMDLAGEWDWMGVFVVEDLSDWEAFQEAYRRRFGDKPEIHFSVFGVAVS